MARPESNGGMDRESPTGATDGEVYEADQDLPSAMRESMRVLRNLQTEHDRLYEEYNVKRRQLDEQYEVLYEPLYEARKKELDKAHISSFWLTAFDNCELISENITEKDRGALEFLKHVWSKTVSTADVAAKTTEHPVGSMIIYFQFDPNPFFTNEVLTKTYVMDPDDDEELKTTLGTKINWKPGKNLTVKVLKRKNKGKGKGRVITKMEPCDSFFNFFSPPIVDEENTELTPEETEALDELVAADLEIGEAICNDVVARAVLWYADEVEDHSDEDEDEEDDDDEDDDDSQEAGGNSKDEGEDEDPEEDGARAGSRNPSDARVYVL